MSQTPFKKQWRNFQRMDPIDKIRMGMNLQPNRKFPKQLQDFYNLSPLLQEYDDRHVRARQTSYQLNMRKYKHLLMKLQTTNPELFSQTPFLDTADFTNTPYRHLNQSMGPALMFVKSQHDLIQQGMTYEKSQKIVAEKYKTLIDDNRNINLQNRDLTKDNRQMSYLSYFEQSMAVQRKMTALQIQRETLKWKRENHEAQMDEIDEENHDKNENQRPLVISQQSRQEKPLFTDQNDILENFRSTIKKYVQIKDRDIQKQDGLQNFTKEQIKQRGFKRIDSAVKNQEDLYKKLVNLGVSQDNTNDTLLFDESSNILDDLKSYLTKDGIIKFVMREGQEYFKQNHDTENIDEKLEDLYSRLEILDEKLNNLNQSEDSDIENASLLKQLKEEREKELDQLEINIISQINKFYKIEDKETALDKFKSLINLVRNTKITQMKELVEFQLYGIDQDYQLKFSSEIDSKSQLSVKAEEFADIKEQLGEFSRESFVKLFNNNLESQNFTESYQSTLESTVRDLKNLNSKISDNRHSINTSSESKLNSLGMKLDIDDGLDIDESLDWLNTLDPNSTNQRLINNTLSRKSSRRMQMSTFKQDRTFYVNDNENSVRNLVTKEARSEYHKDRQQGNFMLKSEATNRKSVDNDELKLELDKMRKMQKRNRNNLMTKSVNLLEELRNEIKDEKNAE